MAGLFTRQAALVLSVALLLIAPGKPRMARVWRRRCVLLRGCYMLEGHAYFDQ